MFIKNGDVFINGTHFEKVLIRTNGSIISDIIETNTVKHTEDIDSEELIDARNMYVIPGLIDTHIHGALGYDTADEIEDSLAEALNAMSSYLINNGVTAFVPTLVSVPESVIEQKAKEYISYMASRKDISSNTLGAIGALPLGLNIEGPYIDASKRGSHNIDYLKSAGISFYKELIAKYPDVVKIVTVSPTKENLEFIEALSRDINISIGHTACTYDEAMLGFKKGANRVTHLYNAMNTLHHREPGLIGAASDAMQAYVELISDNLHVHPAVVRSTFKMIGEDRMLLISDAIRTMGIESGTFKFGGSDIIVKDGKTTLLDGVTLAGATTNLYEAFKIAIADKVPLQSVIKATTINPARSIQVDNVMGSIETGKLANILILDRNFNIKYVIIKGYVVKRA